MAFEREGGLCQRPQSSRSVADGSRLAGAHPESVARRSTLGDRERHVERLRPALEEHGHAVAALEPLRRPLEVLYGAHALAVDLADHVAALQARLGGRAVLVHPRHHHAFGRAQVELAGDLRSQGPRVETQEALALAAGSVACAVSSGVSPILISRDFSPLSRHTLTGTPLPGV